MHRLLLSVGLLAVSCTSALPPPSATPQATPTARVTLRTVDVGPGLGLVADLPVGWSLDALRNVNWGTQRWILASNTDVAGLPVVENNGDVDAAALTSGQVTVEIESFCRILCKGPTDETPLPLDWANAVALRSPLPDGRHELGLGFRWFSQPLFIVARWVDDAPAADIAAIAAIARSVRADPAVPAVGEYRGWTGLGPLAAIPDSSVRLVPLPPGAISRSPYRLYDNEPFFIVRDPQGLLAFPQKPLLDRRCIVAFDVSSDRFTCGVDGRTVAWTRRGSFLGPEPASDMHSLTVIVRDGSVWVDYAD